MKHHMLKLNEKYWEDVARERKPFELRLNDRDYAEGDTITFTLVNDNGVPIQQFNSMTEDFKLVQIHAEITYFMQDEKYLQKDYCVLGIKILTLNQSRQLTMNNN
jgi:ASC-1-like (ASCH) protein